VHVPRLLHDLTDSSFAQFKRPQRFILAGKLFASKAADTTSSEVDLAEGMATIRIFSRVDPLQNLQVAEANARPAVMLMVCE